MDNFVIKFENAKIGYKNNNKKINDNNYNILFDNLNLKFEKEKFYTILGVSGIGKTTLLKTIIGINKLLDGNIYINGDVSILFQEPRLFPHMTVLENVEYPLKLACVNKLARRNEALTILDKLGLHYLIENNITDVHNLSGGEAKRVALARALIRKPQILLLDEPLTNLDTNLKIYIRDLIKLSHDEYNLTTIMVTHDIFDAVMISDKLVVLDKKQVVSVGNISDVLNDEKCKWYFTKFREELNALIKKI